MPRRTKTRERIREMFFGPQKKPVREIARILHVSTQAVYQHLEAIRAEKENGAA